MRFTKTKWPIKHRKSTLRLLAAALAVLITVPAEAQEAAYDFAVTMVDETSVIWRVDRLSGEVGMCRYEQVKRAQIGALKCAGRGAGTGVQQEPGPYGLKAGQFDDESGMFRVNLRTGSASLCYDVKQKNGREVVCTEPSR